MERLKVDLTTHNGNLIGIYKKNNMKYWYINQMQSLPTDGDLKDFVICVQYSFQYSAFAILMTFVHAALSSL